MKKIINFIKRLFKLIFGKDVRTELDNQFNNEGNIKSKGFNKMCGLYY